MYIKTFQNITEGKMFVLAIFDNCYQWTTWFRKFINENVWNFNAFFFFKKNICKSLKNRNCWEYFPEYCVFLKSFVVWPLFMNYGVGPWIGIVLEHDDHFIKRCKTKVVEKQILSFLFLMKPFLRKHLDFLQSYFNLNVPHALPMSSMKQAEITIVPKGSKRN